METAAPRKIYFNRPQRLTQLIGANTTVIVAGRRTGKTDSIAAPFVLRNMQRMPGSTGGIVVPTFKHGLTNTLPGLLAAWKRWGFINGVHYVVGRRPPKSFAKPITEPHDYEHVISFYNGSIAIIISQDRPGSSNSLTLSWLLVDEAKFIDYDKLKDETLPANGGIKSHFGHHSSPQHYDTVGYAADKARLVVPALPREDGHRPYRRYRGYRLRDLAHQISHKSLRNTQSEIPSYLRNHLRRLDRALNQMRSVAVYYKEYSSIENLQLLGENYIKQMKRDLTPLTFQTSILCQRIGIAKDGFYSSMRERHKYNASDFESLDLAFKSLCDDKVMEADNLITHNLITCKADADVNPLAPICIGLDYNANINWIVAGQPSGKRLNIIKSFYVKFERKLPELVADFCAYYASHQNKTVVFYYDSTALGGNYAVNDQDFRWVIIHEFERHGWRVEDVYLGNPMRHDEKYLLINQGFAGKQRLMPFFNRQNNDDLILAIQAAGVSRGRLGFRKDKAGEKLAETEEDRLEHRTDGTDAFDTLYIGCEKFPYNDTGISVALGGIV